MSNSDLDAWNGGFAAAQEPQAEGGAKCPYPQGSPAAALWLDGWYQGVLKRDGLSWRNGPPGDPATQLITRNDADR